MSATAIDGYAIANPHRAEFDGSTYADENCTPATGSNGANATTGGALNLTGGQVRALVHRWEETNPNTPGWSLPDLELAMSRTHVARAEFINRGGQGWDALVAALRLGQYVACQGDSDQFGNDTCSGKFNGDHCVGIHPATRIRNGLRQRWIDDPICKTGRWEYEYILRRYATKLNANVQFGNWTHSVPKVSPLTPLQALINRVTFLRFHEPAAARRWRNAHPIPARETTTQRTARLTAEAAYLTRARIVRLIPIVKSLRRHKPAAAKTYRAHHPIPARETLRQRDDRLTKEILWLRAH